MFGALGHSSSSFASVFPPRGGRGCKRDFSHPCRCASDTPDTKMHVSIATMNNTRWATVKRRSGSDRGRLRGGGPGRMGKPPVKSEREPSRREEVGRGAGAVRVTL